MEWTGSLHWNGYSRFRVDGKTVYGHRYVIELEGADIPSGLLVLHKCDNRKCVNPGHLFFGSHADNSADMRAKGRGTAGEKHVGAKLTNEDVLCIRQMDAKNREIANIFKVSERTISAIKRRQAWKHI